MALIDSMATNYNTLAIMAGNGNGTAEGLEGYTVSGNEVLFTEVGGDSFKVNLEDLELTPEELAELKAAAGVDDAKATEATTKTTAATEVAAASSSDAIQKEIDQLNEEKAKQLAMIESIEKEVQELAESVEEKIAAAAKQREAKVEEHEKAVEKAINENVAQYIADKKAGKDVTQDDLQANVKGALSHIPDVADAVANLFVANSEMDLIDAHLGKLESLSNIVKDLESQINTKQQAFEQAKAAEEAAKQATQTKSCDPIGFMGEDGARFDFIKLDDAFDSTSDFLGAEDQWAEMETLDTTDATGEGAKDGKVTINELEKAGIGLVMTNKDGIKEVMDAKKIAEMFGEDFTIDLESYKNGGTHDAVSTGDHDGDGVADQDLLGTFSVSGSKMAEGGITGYNTLDDQDWLAEKYGIEANVVDKAPAADGTVAAEGAEEVEASAELAPHIEFLAEWKEKANELRDLLDTEFKLQGLSDEYLTLLHETAAPEALAKAEGFYAGLIDAEKPEEADETDKADDVEDAAEDAPVDEAPEEEPAADGEPTDVAAEDDPELLRRDPEEV